MKKNKALKPQSSLLKGKEGFEQYYSSLYGSRWELLKESFNKDSVYATWQIKDKEPYYLDIASVFAAIQLPLENATNILDLCAAPGGKTLVLATTMNKDALLVSNERSASRKNRLLQVCNNCLPEFIRERVKISCSDGSVWCKTQTECYDSILLDAPCSSERHVYLDEKYLNMWTPNRIKTLTIEQWALLSSAFRLLAPGGYLLYSTCALATAENDKNIERLLKKFSDSSVVNIKEFKMPPKEFCKYDFVPIPEKTEYGYHILPDNQNGAGPIWFSLIYKKKKEES